jgi:UDP-N-acetylglucosamine/UDP-N-acetylgalactosamine diphosphorylase
MVSPQTEAATRAFFRERDFFGLDPHQVTFFMQGTQPAVDASGRLLLSSQNSLVLSPGGNGCIYTALRDTGTLDAMVAMGVTRVAVHTVDNVLSVPADPLLLGAAVETAAAFTSLCIERTDSAEKIGSLGLLAATGAPVVIEYSEMGPAAGLRTDPDDPASPLAYAVGSIGHHVITTEFLRACAAASLPLHLAHKKVQYWDPVAQHMVQPQEPNAFKPEQFIFDCLAYAPSFAALVRDRADVFAPVKNADGPDSPETARCAIRNLGQRWGFGTDFCCAESLFGEAGSVHTLQSQRDD